MRLRWMGPGHVSRRVTGPDGQAYEWSAAAGLEQDVDEETALELLTAPGESFEEVATALVATGTVEGAQPAGNEPEWNGPAGVREERAPAD